MKSLTLILILGLVFGVTSQIHAQDTNKEVRQIQPRIIVIPYAKKDQDLRTVLESDISLRVALSKVKEGFDKRGFSTIDFVGVTKAAELDGVFTSNAPADVKTAIIEASKADIYVEVEAYNEQNAAGYSARIILKAYDAFTGQGFGDKTGISPVINFDKFDLLVEKALGKQDGTTKISLIDDFLNVMQEKFTDIVENGRTVKVTFLLDENAAFDFDSETTDGDYLSDAVTDWIADNSYKNNYNEGGANELRLIFDQVRIPLRDENDKNYTPSSFARDIRNGIRKIKLADAPDTPISVERDYRGGTIYITLK